MITVEDVFAVAQRDLSPRAFGQMGAGLQGVRWVMSPGIYAETWAAVRLDWQPVKAPDPEHSMLMALPIRIDEDTEDLRLERF
jgi:hypothetical protein